MSESIKSLITIQKELHPSMRIQDVYKLLFQSTLGPYHIMHHLNHAFSVLNREFTNLDIQNARKEILIENISINHQVVRINLRPFKSQYNSIEDLFIVIRESVATFNPDRENLLRVWDDFKTLVSKNELDFNLEELTEFEKSIDPLHDSNIRHSEDYKQRENPSYRVALKSIFRKHFQDSIE